MQYIVKKCDNNLKLMSLVNNPDQIAQQVPKKHDTNDIDKDNKQLGHFLVNRRQSIHLNNLDIAVEKMRLTYEAIDY